MGESVAPARPGGSLMGVSLTARLTVMTDGAAAKHGETKRMAAKRSGTKTTQPCPPPDFRALSIAFDWFII